MNLLEAIAQILRVYGECTWEDALALLVLLLLAALLAGSAWILWDASERYNPLVGLALTAAHVVLTLKFYAPVVLVLYGGLRLYECWRAGRPVPEDAAPRFGVKAEAIDPQAEARRLGLPAVHGVAGEVAGKLRPEEEDPRLERLLAEGRLAEAWQRAEEMLGAARKFGDADGVRRWRKYLAKLRALDGAASPADDDGTPPRDQG